MSQIQKDAAVKINERKAAETLGGRVSSQARSQATIVKKAAEDVIRAAKLEAVIEKSRKIAEYADAKVQGETNRLQEKEVFSPPIYECLPCMKRRVCPSG